MVYGIIILPNGNLRSEKIVCFKTFPTVDLATPWSICSQWIRPPKNSKILTQGSRRTESACSSMVFHFPRLRRRSRFLSSGSPSVRKSGFSCEMPAVALRPSRGWSAAAVSQKIICFKTFSTVDLATPWSICSRWRRPQKNSKILTEGGRRLVVTTRIRTLVYIY